MLISVVVPALNEEKYIRGCLDALADLEHPTFRVEFVVVDNGSTDRTAMLVRQAGVRLIHEPQRGVACARQAGFTAARGEIIASTDADSMPPRDWLVRIVAIMQAAPDIVGVYGPYQFYDRGWQENIMSRYLTGLFFGMTAGLGKPTFSGQNFAVRREAWERAGGFDPTWLSSEDTLLGFKLARLGRIRFCWDLVMPTSGRRMREGYLSVAKCSIAINYRVLMLHQPPLAFKDIR